MARNNMNEASAESSAMLSAATEKKAKNESTRKRVDKCKKGVDGDSTATTVFDISDGNAATDADADADVNFHGDEAEADAGSARSARCKRAKLNPEVKAEAEDANVSMNANAQENTNDTMEETRADKESTTTTTTANTNLNRRRRQATKPTKAKSTPATKPKSKKKKKEDESLSLTWICTECREAECATVPDAPLLVCEGPCNRPFHYPCAGLLELPPAEEEWICRDCIENRHPCAVCHEYGDDGVDVFKCDRGNCGLFFHEACLNMYDVDVQLVEVVEKEEKTDLGTGVGVGSVVEDAEAKVPALASSDENKTSEVACILVPSDTSASASAPASRSGPKTVPKFQCPAHSCWVCSDGMPPRLEEDNETSNADGKSDGNDEKKKETPKGRRGKKRKKGGGEKLFTAFKAKKERLFRCLECPISYHISCIPPHSNFHELALLCHEHAKTSKLPYLDKEESLQTRVEKRTDELINQLCQKDNRRGGAGGEKKMIKIADGDNKFLMGLKGGGMPKYDCRIGKLFAESDDPIINRLGKYSLGFCTPCTIQQEVHSKPPVYTHVHTNQYDPKHRPKRHPPTNECCQCKPNTNGEIVCDEHCMNRMLGTECVGNGEKKNGQKNPYWNCNLGKDCGNRKLGRRQFTKCKPKREKGKGWGLVTVSGAKKGSLIQEYVGEIIDEKTKRERLEVWARDHPNDPNFYIMSLEPGWYIDARVKGNLSRFINHSCGPNCHLAPVSVNGHTRVGIIAKRDIKPGEFLCYDYQFDTKDSDKFNCRCGAPNCRGTMKGGTNSQDGEEEKKKTKKDIWNEAKAKFEKEKKFLDDLDKDREVRLNQVGVSVPGEIGENARAVSSLPTNAFRAPKTCLWRNTTAGADFASRYLRISSGKTKKRTVSKGNNIAKVDVLSLMKS